MSLAVPVAQAEDPVAALPPPTEVQDSPEALETVDPPAADNSLSKELNVPESDADVEILSSIREDGTKIEEYSRHGRVYMVKISPPHGLPPYYLYDSDGDGKFERRLLGSHKHIAPPEWVIKRF
jgi:hypothetical protein